MDNIERLILDRDYLVELLNGPCSPATEEHPCFPIRREWIDEEASLKATSAFSCLLPGGMPYLHYVLAERNPDTLFNGTSVDSEEKRMRYFIITVIPDTDYPFDVNLPLFHQMRVTGLRCWELTRAVLASCREDIVAVLTSTPRPPILNCARLEWVSLYLGIEPYRGATRLSQQWQSAEEFDGYEADVHLYKLREMPSNPLLQRLIDAYDLDYGIKEGK